MTPPSKISEISEFRQNQADSGSRHEIQCIFNAMWYVYMQELFLRNFGGAVMPRFIGIRKDPPCHT